MEFSLKTLFQDAPLARQFFAGENAHAEAVNAFRVLTAHFCDLPHVAFQLSIQKGDFSFGIAHYEAGKGSKTTTEYHSQNDARERWDSFSL